MPNFGGGEYTPPFSQEDENSDINITTQDVIQLDPSKNILIKTGDNDNGPSGTITMETGGAANDSGDILIKTGDVVTTNAGNITLYAGSSLIPNETGEIFLRSAALNMLEIGESFTNFLMAPAIGSNFDFGGAVFATPGLLCQRGGFLIRTLDQLDNTFPTAPVVIEPGGGLVDGNDVEGADIVLLSGRGTGNDDSGDIVLKAGGVALGEKGKIDMTQTKSKNVVWDSGLTAARPAVPVTGERFFDTTLGLPVWYDGANWVDAAGNIV